MRLPRAAVRAKVSAIGLLTESSLRMARGRALCSGGVGYAELVLKCPMSPGFRGGYAALPVKRFFTYLP